MVEDLNLDRGDVYWDLSFFGVARHMRQSMCNVLLPYVKKTMVHIVKFII